MDRFAAFGSAKQVFVDILKQHGAEFGIDNSAEWADKSFQTITVNLKALDAIDKVFVSEDEKSTNHRTEEAIAKMERILGQYALPSTKLRQLVKVEIRSLEHYINQVKQSRPTNVPAKTNRNAAIEKYITGLKVLKTSLDAVTKDSEAWMVRNQAKLVAYRGNLTRREELETSFKTNLKAAVARALAAAQKIKAKPDVDTYNQEMSRPARDLNEAISPDHNKWREWGLPDPNPHLQALRPFGSGNKSHVDTGTREALIRDWTSEFNKAAKAIQKAYGV